MQYLVINLDTNDWSLDNFSSANTVVVPVSAAGQSDWYNVVNDQCGISEVDFPKIPIATMIRELQDAGRWYKLVSRAKRSQNFRQKKKQDDV